MAAVITAATAYPLWRYLAPSKAGHSNAKVTIPVKAVQEGEAKFFKYARSPAVVVRKKGVGLVALSAVCTHLG